MHRNDLITKLNSYHTDFMEEAAMVARTHRFVAAHEHCFDRTLAYGHVTGSAWVLNPTRTHALMLHHRKLNLWLQPGGHADGEVDMIEVVMKETSEETGIAAEHIRILSEAIFDVDIHTIFPSQFDPRHEHFDIRFLLEIDDAITIPGNDESHQIAWIPLSQVCHYNNLRSLHRMVQKSLTLTRLGKI